MKSGLSGASGFVTVAWGEEALEIARVQFIAIPEKRRLVYAPGKGTRLGGRKKVRPIVARPNNAKASTLRSIEMQAPISVAGVFEPSSTRTRWMRRESVDEYEILRRKIYG